MASVGEETPPTAATGDAAAASVDWKPRDAIVRLLRRLLGQQATGMQHINRALPLIVLPEAATDAAAAGAAASRSFPAPLAPRPLSQTSRSATSAITQESVVKAAAAAAAVGMEDAEMMPVRSASSAAADAAPSSAAAATSASSAAAATSSSSAAASSSSSPTSPPTPGSTHKDEKARFIAHLLKQKPFSTLRDELWRDEQLRPSLASLPHPQLYCLSFHFGVFGAYTLTEKKDDRGRPVSTTERCFFSRADAGKKGQGMRPCALITSMLFSELTAQHIDCGVKIPQEELDRPLAGVLAQLCGRYLAPCTMLADSHVVFKKLTSQPVDSSAVTFMQEQLTARGVAIDKDAKRWSLLHLLKLWTKLHAHKPAVDVKTLCALLVKEQVHVPIQPKTEATAFVSQLLWCNMLAEHADMMHFERWMLSQGVAIELLPFLAELQRQLQRPMDALTLSVRDPVSGAVSTSAAAAAASSSPSSLSAPIAVIAPLGSVYLASIVPSSAGRPPNVDEAEDLCNQPQPQPMPMPLSNSMMLASPSPPAGVASAVAAAAAAASSSSADSFLLGSPSLPIFDPPDLDSIDPAIQDALVSSYFSSSHQ